MRVDIDDVEDDENLVFHQGEPFTGEVVERRPDGSLVTLYTYDTGSMDGPYQEWYPGEVLYKEGTMRLGLAVGLHRRWYPDGGLAEEWLFGDRGGQVEHRKWDQDGNPLPTGSG